MYFKSNSRYVSTYFIRISTQLINLSAEYKYSETSPKWPCSGPSKLIGMEGKPVQVCYFNLIDIQMELSKLASLDRKTLQKGGVRFREFSLYVVKGRSSITKASIHKKPSGFGLSGAIIDSMQLNKIKECFIITIRIQQIDGLKALKYGKDHSYSLLDCEEEIRSYHLCEPKIPHYSC